MSWVSRISVNQTFPCISSLCSVNFTWVEIYSIWLNSQSVEIWLDFLRTYSLTWFPVRGFDLILLEWCLPPLTWFPLHGDYLIFSGQSFTWFDFHISISADLSLPGVIFRLTWWSFTTYDPERHLSEVVLLP